MSPWRWGRSWATLCRSGASAADIGSPTPLQENGGNQLRFQRRNTFGEIDRAQITLDRGYEYELKLPRKEVFFIHTGVDSRIPTGLASVEQITLYDGEGQDITESFFMSMGGIQ